MHRFLLLIPVYLFVAACGSDDSPSASPPPEITAFQSWGEETPQALATVEDLAVLSRNAETNGEVPSFFQKTILMSRDERDNVQNGYIYPLYFATPSLDFPSRQWEDGLTVQKRDLSGPAEERKVRSIRDGLFDFWGNDNSVSLFYGLSNYKLIDVRHYSFKPAPPHIKETCFTVRWETNRRGTLNYCYEGHRYSRDKNGQFPKVRWDNQTGVADDIEAFQLFVVSLAAYEVLFNNPDNQELRDFFITHETLATQMQKANEAYDGIFDSFIENQNYLNGRQ